MSSFPKLSRLKVDDECMEKLHVAARKGLVEKVRLLVDSGIDPNIANHFGCTALHLACKFGRVEVAEYLAEFSDIQLTWHGQKPLHLAVLSNKLELVSSLVEGAKKRNKYADNFLNDCDDMEVTQVGVHFRESKGQTALHWCVGLGDDYLPMLELLIKLGASPTARDKEGETVLMCAMQLNNDAAMAIMLDKTPAASLRLEVADARGRSHLHWACLTNHQDYGLRFLELGEDPNVEDESHVVPLFLAVRSAMPRLTAALLEKGDPFLVQNAPFHNGRTVIADRIDWMPFVVSADDQEGKGNGREAHLEAAKAEVVALLQQHLTKILESLDATSSALVKRKKKVNVKKMHLAPSAPVRNRSRSRTSASQTREVPR